MTVRVAINGFGRIGRNIVRAIHESGRKDIDVVAVNDLGPVETNAHLLRFDSVHGRFPREVEVDGDTISVGSDKFKVTAIKDPSQLPWKELGIDLVFECTGAFAKREDLEKHVRAGARTVLLSAPAKGADVETVIHGVNKPTGQSIMSCASCTTNSITPIVEVIGRRIGFSKAVMTTVHAYTNDQRLADVPHEELRRSRAATENIIPTTTGAAKAVALVLPELKGKLDGMAMRVPVPDGSTVDFVVELERPATVAEVNAAVKAAAEGELKGILEYSEEPLVSTDIIGNPHSSIFDALSTHSLGGNLVKVLAWYDNEWGYSSRVVDLIERMGALIRSADAAARM